MKISKLKKKLGEFSLSVDSAQFSSGVIHGLIGPNGSGKSTLLKLIMGTIQPDNGEIDFEGLHPRQITLAGQKPYMLHDSVYRNLIYPLKLRKLPVDQMLADDLLKQAGLLEKKHQYARSLSSGEQQKLSLIRALIFSPKLFLIDESLSNLDPDSFSVFEQLIMSRQTESPATWIIISHQLASIHRICQQVHFMYNGNIIESGSTESILYNTVNPLIQAYCEQQSLPIHQTTGT